MKYLITPILIAILLSQSLWGQQVPDLPEDFELNPYPFISTVLLNLDKSADRSPEIALIKAKDMYMPTKGNKIYVEIIRGSETDLDQSIDEELLNSLPHIELTTVYKNRASSWIDIDKLMEVGRQLPEPYRLGEVIMDPPDNQGPVEMNSDSYSSQGGNGIKVAVIDGGFDMLTEARNASAAPSSANTTVLNYTGNALETGGVHGTACIETVYDHAPNADYVICKINSLSDMGNAVDDCIAQGVDIITHSISRYNTGWADGTGSACAAAQDAAANGILFFTSAGNRNGTHYQGFHSDPDNDNWVNFSGSDEANNFTMNGTSTSSARVSMRLQWNSSSSIDHYDLYLYQSGGGILASSTNSNSFEYISYTTNSTQNVYFAVRAKTSNPPEFEVFNHDSRCTNFQFASTTGSTTSPSNSTSGNVISVGAVHHTNYSSAEGTTGIIASYSSRGPTNGGVTGPDVTGPTSTTTVAYGGAFGGTSCSTPNSAGAAAAFWSGHPQLNATGVRYILFAKADCYRDWGSNGADNIYGRGGVYLHDYSSANRYIVKDAMNTSSSSTLPYFSMEDVDDDASVPSNRNIIYLEGADFDPSGVVDKAMFYESVKGTLID